MTALTADQLKTVDKKAVDSFDISIIQLMELAGLRTAEWVRHLTKQIRGKQILIVSGKGNNGADGIVAGCYLSNWGAEVTVYYPETPTGEIPVQQLNRVKRLPVQVTNEWPEYGADVIVDALLGFGLDGPPKAPYSEAIQRINESNFTIISIDCPSGLNVTTGEAYAPSVKATSTISLGSMKKGFLINDASLSTGDVVVADIGIPPTLYASIGLEPPIDFSIHSLLKFNHKEDCYEPI